MIFERSQTAPGTSEVILDLCYMKRTNYQLFATVPQILVLKQLFCVDFFIIQNNFLWFLIVHRTSTSPTKIKNIIAIKSMTLIKMK